MKYNPVIVLAYFQESGLPDCKTEFRFHSERLWRFDFAFPRQKLYIEVQGGIWIRGGHCRGAQIKKEWEKQNAASALGWRGLWCEPKDLCTGAFVDLIKKAVAYD